MHPIEEKLRKFLPLGSKKADPLWRYFLSGQGKEREETDEIIDIILHKTIQKDFRKKILLDPPNPNLCYGEYNLGAVVYPDKSFASFGLRENEWCKHVLITGMTGTGKTNTVFQILNEFAQKGKPFLIFDWKKNYRDMIQFSEFKDMIVFTAGSSISKFSFNPLAPPEGVEPTQWLMRLIDVIKHAYFVGEGVEYLLREAIHHFYTEFEIYNGEKKYPTFFLIYDYIRKKKLKGRMALWLASAYRVLDSLTFPRSMGSIMNENDNQLLKNILNKKVIIELDALADSDKVFLTEALIMWIYEMRKNEGKREQFKHALIIEEGHHILSEKKEHMEGIETVMETALRQIREFGEAVIVVDQEPNKLSDSIKANTYAKMTFNLGNGKDVLDISKAMMLDDEETQFIDLLSVGFCIVKLKGRFYQPILVKFPLVGVVKGIITDERVEKHMKGLTTNDHSDSHANMLNSDEKEIADEVTNGK